MISKFVPKRVSPGDIILADRGYSHREGVVHVIEAGGDVVVRLNGSNFPLVDSSGRQVNILELSRSLNEYEAGEWPVEFNAMNKRYSARLCAIRKSVAAADRAKRGILRTAMKKGRTEIQPETLELAEYVIVLTTLSGTLLSAIEVLELYRARWQIELFFKRIKSLFGSGHVPKYDPQSAKAWIFAKLLSVLIIEQLSREAHFFSPWGFELQEPKPMA